MPKGARINLSESLGNGEESGEVDGSRLSSLSKAEVVGTGLPIPVVSTDLAGSMNDKLDLGDIDDAVKAEIESIERDIFMGLSAAAISAGEKLMRIKVLIEKHCAKGFLERISCPALTL